MNYLDQLLEVGRKAATARAQARQADAERDYWIRAANYHGAMTSREISGYVGISQQRVAQIINTDPIAPTRPTLHAEMLAVLARYGTDWMPVNEVARLITERGRYRRKDGAPLPGGQIRARAGQYPDLFEGTTDGTNRIRARKPADREPPSE